jgi:hypothetical protein
MKRLVLLVVLLGAAAGLFADKVYYAEQYYDLYHRQMYMYPENVNENLWYLERCLTHPLANPLNALARVETEAEYERYRYLFYMHIYLEIIRSYRIMAAGYDKRQAYFYNAPWRDVNLKSLEIARYYYETALGFWDEAQEWSAKAAELAYVNLEEIQAWEDESWMIENGELDFEEIIGYDLARVDRVTAAFEAMEWPDSASPGWPRESAE